MAHCEYCIDDDSENGSQEVPATRNIREIDPECPAAVCSPCFKSYAAWHADDDWQAAQVRSDYADGWYF